MPRHRTSYVAPPDALVQNLAHPVEAAVYEFIDNNYDQLLSQYSQGRLKSRRGVPPTDQELKGLESEAEKYMDDVLPGQILSSIDLDRIGYDKFIQQRLSDIFLSGIADKLLGAGMQQAASTIERVAARIAKIK